LAMAKRGHPIRQAILAPDFLAHPMLSY